MAFPSLAFLSRPPYHFLAFSFQFNFSQLRVWRKVFPTHTDTHTRSTMGNLKHPKPWKFGDNLTKSTAWWAKSAEGKAQKEKCQKKNVRKTRHTICWYRHLPLSIFSCQSVEKKMPDKAGKKLSGQMPRARSNVKGRERKLIWPRWAEENFHKEWLTIC